ncbi:MAG: hypothetical protein KGI02_05110 [Thaumarchaeota archaeon]|nr:hypothetical protein [Nitrososphaerota archaeon]
MVHLRLKMDTSHTIQPPKFPFMILAFVKSTQEKSLPNIFAENFYLKKYSASFYAM